MNAIIQYGSIEAIPLYNCSAHSSEEWSKLGGVRHPYFGRFDIVFGITAIILYIPILSVMFQTEYYRMSCFKIMICLGIVDMMALSINSVITGILAIEGAVWCNYPNFNYVSGSIVLGLWCCSCIIVLGLVANRLLEMSKPSWSYALFNGYRTYMMMIIPVIYGLYFSVYTNPVGFNSKYYTWLFDPMINDDRSEEYHNIPHSINNVLIVAVTCVLYAWLYFTIKEKMSMISWKNRRQDLSFQILVQSAMICSINLIASIIFVLMNFVQLPIWIIITAQKMWQFIHAIPVVIYLLLNKTIRNGFLRRLRWKKKVTSLASLNPHNYSVNK
ncbi:hypothetical protein CAEBREN_05917 [Caenorhabditis brenneri]|uniref:Uncharacterized protein n=1 Tax=Caenorhabditis brenneri TaxID=135651 RepID=G0MID4_CAEBE|nr:hypothetical protein CAEBREN_05917 [Caenorhabditis brenneri]